MRRNAMQQLYDWKEKSTRKPLIIRGARQVGKTWLMKEFGEKAYENTVYINFDSNSQMTELFSSDLNIEEEVSVGDLLFFVCNRFIAKRSVIYHKLVRIPLLVRLLPMTDG